MIFRARRAVGICAATGAIVAAVGLTSAPLPARAATSHNIAYVFDSSDFPGQSTGGTGTCPDLTTKTCTIGISDTSLPGGSIFRDAIPSGTALGTGDTGTYTVGSASYTFTNVQLSQLDAQPSLLSTYDTVMLYQVCTIGASVHAASLTAVNNYLTSGGKVIVMDADRCAGSRHPNYSGFLFPFTSSNPGAAGDHGNYVTVEASSLTSGLSATYSDGSSDAMGDSNVFTTNAGAWCSAITGLNGLGTTGIVEAYARTAAGGLAIFEGEDVNFTFFPTPHLATVFNDILAQAHNPDGLPCTTAASGITLTPATQTVTLGNTASLAATIVDVTGHPGSGIAVTFTCQSGPDSGTTGPGTTDSTGKATTSYKPAATGTDTWVASFKDEGGNVHTSNTATVIITASAGGPTPTASAQAVTTPATGGTGDPGAPNALLGPPLAAGGAVLLLTWAFGVHRRRRR